jgi:membrane protein YqaA with SNARE-associated domain
MDFVVNLLIDYGYWGMLISAFLAASILPFSSEAVMLGLLAAGLDPWPLIIYGTIGNVAGSMFNYSIGCMGRLRWIEKYLHVKKKDLDRAERFMGGHGAWMGFFAFLPVIGDVITIVLGLMHANLVISVVSISIGKFLRYVVLFYSANLIF